MNSVERSILEDEARCASDRYIRSRIRHIEAEIQTSILYAHFWMSRASSGISGRLGKTKKPNPDQLHGVDEIEWIDCTPDEKIESEFNTAESFINRVRDLNEAKDIFLDRLEARLTQDADDEAEDF